MTANKFNTSELLYISRKQWDDVQSELATLREQLSGKTGELESLKMACIRLIEYRYRAGALNFQLEKADDFIREIQDIVMPTSLLDKWRIAVIQTFGMTPEEVQE